MAGDVFPKRYSSETRHNGCMARVICIVFFEWDNFAQQIKDVVIANSENTAGILKLLYSFRFCFFFFFNLNSSVSHLAITVVSNFSFRIKCY